MWCIHNAISFEKRGVPTVTISTSGFTSLVRETARAKGFPNLSIINVSHPVGGLDADIIKKKADDAIGNLLAILPLPLEKGSE